MMLSSRRSEITYQMFQHNPVLRTAISGCKINALCVLSAASFWWLHGRHGAGVLEAGSLPPVPATAAQMGNSPKVAMRHYLQVTDAEFERAAGVGKQGAAKPAAFEQQNPQQQAPASACSDAQSDQQTLENMSFSHAGALSNRDPQNKGNARDRNRTCTPFGTGT